MNEKGKGRKKEEDGIQKGWTLTRKKEKKRKRKERLRVTRKDVRESKGKERG